MKRKDIIDLLQKLGIAIGMIVIIILVIINILNWT